MDFENDTCSAVVDNHTKEDEFNEHAFFGLFKNELSNFEGEELHHHFDFEINNFEEVFNENIKFHFGDNELELQQIFISTPKIIEKETTRTIFNKTTFVFPNQHSTLKSFMIWFFILKLCLTYLTRQMNRSLEDRFIYFLTIYFLISCKYDSFHVNKGSLFIFVLFFSFHLG